MNAVPNILEGEMHFGNGAYEVQTINPLNGPEWDNLVSRHPDAEFFHSSAWARVLVKTYGHLPSYFALYVNGKLGALVPVLEVNSILTGRRGVCLPFTDFCSPLIFDRINLDPIIDALCSLSKTRLWNYFEIRLDSSVPVSSATATDVTFLAHSLDLTVGPDRLFESFNSSHRRSIRKAVQSGLSVEVRTDKAAVETFFELHARTRRKHGLPPQARNFFNNIHSEIIESGLGFITLASLGEETVAGSVFFHNAGKAIYKFGASDERRLDLRANHLVMWHSIRFLAIQGFKSLHFGRTTSTQDGLRRFKLNWGASETVLDYLRFAPGGIPCMINSDRTVGFHNVFFSRFPLILNRLLGTLIYPHMD